MSKSKLSRKEELKRKAFIEAIKQVEREHGYRIAVTAIPPMITVKPLVMPVSPEAAKAAEAIAKGEPTNENARPRAPWYKRLLE